MLCLVLYIVVYTAYDIIIYYTVYSINRLHNIVKSEYYNILYTISITQHVMYIKFIYVIKST